MMDIEQTHTASEYDWNKAFLSSALMSMFMPVTFSASVSSIRFGRSASVNGVIPTYGLILRLRKSRNDNEALSPMYTDNH